MAGALKEPHPEIIFLDVALDRSDAIDGIRILRQGSFAGAVQLISGKDPELLNDIKAIGERHGLKMLDPLRKPFRSGASAADFQPAAAATPQPMRSRRQPATRAVPPAFAATPSVDLAEALEQHWLDMAYQPKVDLHPQSCRRRRGPRPPQSSGPRRSEPAILPAGRDGARASTG